MVFSKMEFFIKNRIFHQKWKFSAEMEIFGKNAIFRQKWNFSSKNGDFYRKKNNFTDNIFVSHWPTKHPQLFPL